MERLDNTERVPTTIRMQKRIYRQVHIAAVMSGKSIGQWVEEALYEKLNREAPQIARLDVDDNELEQTGT